MYNALFADGENEDEWRVASEKCLHPIVEELCFSGSLVRDELNQFLANTDLQHLPRLRKIAAQFLFTPITERWVEGLHAQTRHSLRRSGPRAGPSKIVFDSIMPEVKQRVASEPELLDQLAQCWSAVNGPLKAVQQVGLANHPTVKELLRAHGVNGVNRKHVGRLVDLTFHCDPESHYQPLPKEEFSYASWVTNRHCLPQLRRPDTADVADMVWCRAAFQHFKTWASETTEQTLKRPVFSLGPFRNSTQSQHFLALQAVAAPNRSHPQHDEDWNLTPVNVAPSQHTAPTYVPDRLLSMVFFQVVQFEPGRLHLPAGLPQVLPKDSVLVGMLPVLDVDRHEHTITLGFEVSPRGGAENVFILSAKWLDRENLDTLRHWEPVSQGIQFVLPVFLGPLPTPTESLQLVLSKMLTQQAFEGAIQPRSFTPDAANESEEATLHWLTSCRVAQQQEQFGQHGWQLTSWGMTILQAAQLVRNSGSDRSVHSAYLRCLLKLQDDPLWLPEGIPHLQKQSFYLNLLDGKSPFASRRRAQDFNVVSISAPVPFKKASRRGRPQRTRTSSAEAPRPSCDEMQMQPLEGDLPETREGPVPPPVPHEDASEGSATDSSLQAQVARSSSSSSSSSATCSSSTPSSSDDECEPSNDRQEDGSPESTASEPEDQVLWGVGFRKRDPPRICNGNPKPHSNPRHTKNRPMPHDNWTAIPAALPQEDSQQQHAPVQQPPASSALPQPLPASGSSAALPSGDTRFWKGADSL